METGKLKIYSENGKDFVISNLVLKDNSYMFSFEYEKEMYFGVFCIGTTEGGKQVMTLSAVGNNNKTIWGVAE